MKNRRSSQEVCLERKDLKCSKMQNTNGNPLLMRDCELFSARPRRRGDKDNNTVMGPCEAPERNVTRKVQIITTEQSLE